MQAPDYAFPCTGWRVWRVQQDDEGLRLRSVVYEAVWEPGERFEAECLCRSDVEPHDCPGNPCPHQPECGIYSSTDVHRVKHYLTGYGKPIVGNAVFGLVKSWGTVVECDAGFRSQFAYPERIWLPCDSHQYAKGLKTYGVPVEKVNDNNRLDALLRVARRIKDDRLRAV